MEQALNKLLSGLVVLFGGFSVALLWRWCTGNNFHAFADAFTYAILTIFLVRERRKAPGLTDEIIALLIVAGLVFVLWAYKR